MRKKQSLVDVECEECKNIFKVTRYRLSRGRVRFCSRKCQSGHKNITNYKPLTKNCFNCGKEFRIYKCLDDKGYEKYCSKKCFCEYKVKSRIKRICEVCGKEFHIVKSRLKAANHGKFCSIPCKGKWMEKNCIGKNNSNWSRVEVFCENCGKSKLVIQSDIGKRKGFFCNRECKGMWMSKNVRGETSYSWRGGSTSYPSEFCLSLKETIRNRDGRKCFICKNKEEDNRLLDIHHIDYDKRNNREINLVSLCRKCHMRTNGNRDYWTEVLSEAMRDYDGR